MMMHNTQTFPPKNLKKYWSDKSFQEPQRYGSLFQDYDFRLSEIHSSNCRLRSIINYWGEKERKIPYPSTLWERLQPIWMLERDYPVNLEGLIWLAREKEEKKREVYFSFGEQRCWVRRRQSFEREREREEVEFV